MKHHFVALSVATIAVLLSGCSKQSGRAPLSPQGQAVISKYDGEVIKIDLQRAEKRDAPWNPKYNGYTFNGISSFVHLTNSGITKKIASRDFSIFLQARLEPQPCSPGYILEHHIDFPWTGLFLAVENNKDLRFRLKDLPHCQIMHPIGTLIGDSKYHNIVLSRRAKTLEMYIDGALAVSGEQPELVNLDIDYGPNLPMLGAHCQLERKSFFTGCLNNVHFFVGRALSVDEVRALN